MRAKSRGGFRGGARGGDRGGRGFSRGGDRGGRGGGKAMVNKYKEAAQMGALLSQNKSFAIQRLLRDWNEIKVQTQNSPLLGVSASPLENSMYNWHGNIKALTQNVFKGNIKKLISINLLINFL